jgi:ABC-type Fe3+ transport system permease subunit
MTLPTNVVPGRYFALIEAHRVARGEGVAVGAAAATKLTFTVKPSSWLQAQQVRLNRWIDQANPWSYLIPGALLAATVLVAIRRYFRVGLRIERR